MSGYFLKNPGSVLDYSFDWGFQFLEGGETIATDLGWIVHPQSAVGSLVITSTSNTPTVTTAFLSGGQPGETYLICSRIRTSLGREIQRSLTVRIANN